MSMTTRQGDGRVVHSLKIDRQWADARLCGDLDFEFRLNDRGFQKGDLLKYTVVDPKTKTPVEHPLNNTAFVITYVVAGMPGIERGYAVFNLRPYTEKERK